jgi:hypothetical protein
MSGSMMAVRVVQYLRPHGRRSLEETDIDARHEKAYARMLALGWNLAAEVLTGGAVSITVEDRHEEIDRAIRVVANGPGVQRAIEEVLEEACPEQAKPLEAA